jgi:hypothetical protein
MKSKSANRPATLAQQRSTASATAAGNLTQILARIAKGGVELAELLALAEGFKHAGQLDSTNKIYRAWIESTQSPFKYVALFNLGVGLSEAGQNSEHFQAQVGLESIYIQITKCLPLYFPSKELRY